MPCDVRVVHAGVLDIAIEESGNAHGVPVVLSHGFPYDVRAFDGVVAQLGAREYRIIVPYLRGYGDTAYRSPETLRSGQQAALASDLLALLDALDIERAIVAGYDWGGRAACIVGALFPERVRGLVTGGGYNVHTLAGAGVPLAPAAEAALWYQYYLHGERGRLALAEHRDAFCRYLWQTWSPTWQFDDPTFERTARAFHNPDFVETVLHSYRYRFGLVAGDPSYAAMEDALERRPPIDVPTISLQGMASGLHGALSQPDSASHFTSHFEERKLDGVGHNVPQEAPRAFAAAIVSLATLT